jgi:DNA-binding NarL/FixJ family response regulator
MMMDPGLVTELTAVAEAAGARLRAETDADGEAAHAAAGRLVAAASAAMAGGHPLIDIARAEVQGKEDVRDALRADTLRSVERTGRRARETRSEHHQAIGRAMRLGLSTREIAAAAEVTHGTVRAISNRVSAEGAAKPQAGMSGSDIESHEGRAEEVAEGQPQRPEEEDHW